MENPKENTITSEPLVSAMNALAGNASHPLRTTGSEEATEVTEDEAGTGTGVTEDVDSSGGYCGNEYYGTGACCEIRNAVSKGMGECIDGVSKNMGACCECVYYGAPQVKPFFLNDPFFTKKLLNN